MAPRPQSAPKAPERRAQPPRQLEKLDVNAERKKSSQLVPKSGGQRPASAENARPKRKESGEKKRNKSKSKVAVALPVHGSLELHSLDREPPPKGASTAVSMRENSRIAEANEDDNADGGGSATAERKRGDRHIELDDAELGQGLFGIYLQSRTAEQLCMKLGLTLADVRKMKVKYDQNDMYLSGEITQAEFFYIINEERRTLTKGIVQLGDVSVDQKFISFEEYVRCVVSFAAMTKPELYQFVFDLYDVDHSGCLDEKEFAHMSQELQCKQFSFPKNVTTAMKMLEAKGATKASSNDGLIDLSDLMQFSRYFPVAFFPIDNCQRNVRLATLGCSRWSRIVGRKMKVATLLRHMRRNNGAMPEMSWMDKLFGWITGDIYWIYERAAAQFAEDCEVGRPR